MKHFVLAYLLFLFTGIQLIAQTITAKAIVEGALKAHSGGNALNQYKLKVDFDTLSGMSAELFGDKTSLNKLDSIKKTLPDSVRKIIELNIKNHSSDFYKDIAKEYAHFSDEIITDFSLKKSAWIRLTFNDLNGKTDSAKSIYNLKTSHFVSKYNPLEILGRLMSDTVVLRYAGRSSVNGIRCHVIQTKKQSEWIDVYISEGSHILQRWSEPVLDSDKSKRKRPFQQKEIITYKDFKLIKGFLMPVSVEEVSTNLGFSVKKKLRWTGLNEPVSVSLFSSRSIDNEAIKFKVVEMGNGLYVMEQQGRFQNDRILIRQSQKKIDLFTDVSNTENTNEKLINALLGKFPGHQIDNIFHLQNEGGLASHKSFFAQNAKVFSPKGSVFFDETKELMSSSHDSTARLLHSQARMTTFDKEFKTEAVNAIILNPVLENEFSQYQVCYYLPNEKVIFCYGNPYSAESDSKNAKPREKLLYETIKSRRLKVDSIVYSAAYLDDAPFFMSFDDFERRIQNTDFKIYQKRKKY